MRELECLGFECDLKETCLWHEDICYMKCNIFKCGICKLQKVCKRGKEEIKKRKKK